MIRQTNSVYGTYFFLSYFYLLPLFHSLKISPFLFCQLSKLSQYYFSNAILQLVPSQSSWFLKYEISWAPIPDLLNKNLCLWDPRNCCLNVHSFFFFFLVFLGLYQWHMEVPRPAVESELQLPSYTTARAMLGPSCICYLHHSSGQWKILNSLSGARDQIHVLVVISPVCYDWATMGTPKYALLMIHLCTYEWYGNI